MDNLLNRREHPRKLDGKAHRILDLTDKVLAIYTVQTASAHQKTTNICMPNLLLNS